MQMSEKVGKSWNTVFFQWFVAPEGRKVGSLKRQVRSHHLARWEMNNCTPLWREAHFQVKMYKAHQVRTTFGSWDVEKVHAVVARSTFPSQNAQSTPGSDHFWRFRCRLCTLSKVSKTWRFCSIFNYNHHYTTLHSNYNYTFTTFHYTTLHSTTLHSTPLHSTTLHSITISYTTLHYTTNHYTTLHHTTLHYTTLNYTLHYKSLHYTALHYTTFHYTTIHYTPLH